MNLLRRSGTVVVGSALALSCSAKSPRELTDSRTQPLAAAGWHTDGAKIHAPDGSDFWIDAINWYGFETRNAVAHGLYAVSHTQMLQQIVTHGFNTVRIPFSNEMWETNPTVRSGSVSACPDCKNKRSREILALIINEAGALGLHVILDNHRSSAGNSAETNGMWYTDAYPELAWIEDWRQIQAWVNDPAEVDYLAADGKPIVLGFDVRNEPHTGGKGRDAQYLSGATWGTGDGIDPASNPNPNPFAPGCVASSACHDWRLAAERVGSTLMGDAFLNGWAYPLIFVEGIGLYPADGTSPPENVTDSTWWGGNLRGPRGNSTNPGAPVVFNVGGDASALGAPVDDQLVYSAHDYGVDLYAQDWFNAGTCYASGCGSSSLADLWFGNWAYLTDDVAPVWPGHASYPWGNTGHAGYTATPVFVGEFGTGNDAASLFSTGPGSQGQWFTALVNFIQSSREPSPSNYSGLPVQDLHFAYWALNGNDAYSLLTNDWDTLANTDKLDTFLCAIQSQPAATCDVGALPSPGDTAPPPGCDVDADCDDGEACNGVEVCDVDGQCVVAVPPMTCDDGDACNGVETCSAGACQPGSPLVCDDADTCNGVYTCDAVLGCVEQQPPCDDGNACNGTETCEAGVCSPGTPPSCDDGQACNGVESCDPVTGCVAPTLCCAANREACSVNTDCCSNNCRGGTCKGN